MDPDKTVKDGEFFLEKGTPHPFPTLPMCIGKCGLLAETGDVFCSGCREGYNHDPSWIMEVGR